MSQDGWHLKNRLLPYSLPLWTIGSVMSVTSYFTQGMLTSIQKWQYMRSCPFHVFYFLFISMSFGHHTTLQLHDLHFYYKQILLFMVFASSYLTQSSVRPNFGIGIRYRPKPKVSVSVSVPKFFLPKPKVSTNLGFGFGFGFGIGPKPK